MRIIGILGHNNEQIFEILENCLISDENQEIRSLSSEIILNQYIHEGLNTLKWAIMNENSAQVLSHLKSILNKKNKPYSTLKKILNLRTKTIASDFEVIIEEVQILLDLGIQLNTNSLLKMDNHINYIYQEDFMCIIRNKHIKEINLTSYPKIPNSIGKLELLENLNFSCNYFSGLPTEFKDLTNIKTLDLSWNELKGIPDELSNLHSLQELNLSNNFITEVPEWISNLENLVYLNLTGNKIRNIPNSIKSFKKKNFLY
ncbi:MAG: leucine-rich repeat domain-containing protein [Promethearchaeota archaeon]